MRLSRMSLNSQVGSRCRTSSSYSIKFFCTSTTSIATKPIHSVQWSRRYCSTDFRNTFSFCHEASDGTVHCTDTVASVVLSNVVMRYRARLGFDSKVGSVELPSLRTTVVQIPIFSTFHFCSCSFEWGSSGRF